MVAVRLANISHGGDRKSSGIKTEISELISQPQAAQMLNVSDDAVGMGRKVIERAMPQLSQMVERGEVAD